MSREYHGPPSPSPPNDVLVVLLPLLIVLSTLLFLLLLFLVSILILRRRRGIHLSDYDGPVDMSREDLIEGDGRFESLQNNWLETVSESERRLYHRAREFQLQYPPNSLPTDITLSQFLSIQEKGVSAWSFEPDYETVNSLLVHARTEITFLPDPASASCVQSNLPLPKLNEVYYWEVKMFDLPETTTVSIGLATKPYPAFRLPGHSRYSVAFHSNGEKTHNWPFTATSYGPQLKEGDVLGVGYRPRAGTLFFTRNGRKLDDAFTGMSRWNLFPTIGADGPCSVHVNFGQSGFVFIEANVKKWGLAPSVGTLAPPPAYGSEHGSILLDVGGGVPTPRSDDYSPSTSSSPAPRRSSQRSRRSRNTPSSIPVASSPLRASSIPAPSSPPPPITPIDEEESPRDEHRYISPTDRLFHQGRNAHLPSSPGVSSPQPLDPINNDNDDDDDDVSSPSSSSRSPSPDSTAIGASLFSMPRHHRQSSLTHAVASFSNVGASSNVTVQVHPPPDSPRSPNPPTPNHRDIHMQALSSSSSNRRRSASETGGTSAGNVINDDIPIDRLAPGGVTRREPALPPYSPIDAFAYSDGAIHLDLPAEVIAAALEGQPSSPPPETSGRSRTRRSSRR